MAVSSEPGEPWHRILLFLLAELGWLALLVTIPILLPLPLAFFYWLTVPCAEWIQNRRAGAVGERVAQWGTASCFGLGFAVCHNLPGFLLAYAGGLATILCSLWLLIQFEERSGLVRRRHGVAVKQVPPPSRSSTSAWGGTAPVTPEGGSVRILGGGEIAMGGPVIRDYLFPDGTLIRGAGASSGFSPDGRYFVSPVPSREAWGLLLLDRKDRLLYRCRHADMFWEIDEVGDAEIVGRDSPLTANTSYSAAIEDLKAHAEVESFVQVRDLWIPEGDWGGMAASGAVPAPDVPAGGPALVIRPRLPDSLASLADPLEPLFHPMGEVIVEDVPSGLEVSAAWFAPVWRGDGRAFACRARRAGEDHTGLWLWEATSGWREVAASLSLEQARPSAAGARLDTLDAHALRIRWRLSQPALNYRTHGPVGSATHGAIRLVVGHDAQGRATIAEAAAPGVWHVVPLASGTDGEWIESASLATGERMEWHWLRDRTDGRGQVYRCRIGAWQLDGEWLLDHRISGDGTHVALIAFADVPAVPHQIAVADVRARRLEWLAEPVLDPQLQGFIEGELHFCQLLGRTDYAPPKAPGEGTPGLLRRFDEAAPSPGNAHGFLAFRGDSRLYYEQRRAGCRDGQWRVQPHWRLAHESPASVAEGAFLLPSPTGDDAAWGFGFETSSPGDINPAAERTDGYMLTRSGCGIARLAPPMIWRREGRYLACTRATDRDAWRLLLVDTEERTVRTFSEPLCRYPRFGGFADALEILCEDPGLSAWQRLARRRSIAIDDLLAAPAVTLMEGDGCWIEGEQWLRRRYWERLSVPATGRMPV